MNAAPQPGETYLSFDGVNSYVEIPSLPCYSVDHTWEFTVAGWLRADVDDFTRVEDGKPYVYWLGKGEDNHERGTQEWSCRMYNLHTPGVNPVRPKRMSFYVYNPQGGLGVGSYFQPDPPVEIGVWRLIVGMVDRTRTYLYCDGEYRHCSTYRGPATGKCRTMEFPPVGGPQVVINPLRGNAPVRIGARELDGGRFQGGIAKVRMWNRLLTNGEIRALYLTDDAPRDWLAGEFLLSEGEGDRARDTGYMNHGTIHGASWATQT